MVSPLLLVALFLHLAAGGCPWMQQNGDLQPSLLQVEMDSNGDSGQLIAKAKALEKKFLDDDFALTHHPKQSVYSFELSPNKAASDVYTFLDSHHSQVSGFEPANKQILREAVVAKKDVMRAMSDITAEHGSRVSGSIHVDEKGSLLGMTFQNKFQALPPIRHFAKALQAVDSKLMKVSKIPSMQPVTSGMKLDLSRTAPELPNLIPDMEISAAAGIGIFVAVIIMMGLGYYFGKSKWNGKEGKKKWVKGHLVADKDAKAAADSKPEAASEEAGDTKGTDELDGKQPDREVDAAEYTVKDNDANGWGASIIWVCEKLGLGSKPSDPVVVDNEGERVGQHSSLWYWMDAKDAALLGVRASYSKQMAEIKAAGKDHNPYWGKGEVVMDWATSKSMQEDLVNNRGGLSHAGNFLGSLKLNHRLWRRCGSMPWSTCTATFEDGLENIALGATPEQHDAIRPPLDWMWHERSTLKTWETMQVQTSAKEFFDAKYKAAAALAAEGKPALRFGEKFGDGSDDSCVWVQTELWKSIFGASPTPLELEDFCAFRDSAVPRIATPDWIASLLVTSDFMKEQDKWIQRMKDMMVAKESNIKPCVEDIENKRCYQPKDFNLVIHGIFDALVFAGGLSVPNMIHNAVATAFGVNTKYPNGDRTGLFDDPALHKMNKKWAEKEMTTEDARVYAHETSRWFGPVVHQPMMKGDHRIMPCIWCANFDEGVWEDAEKFVPRTMDDYAKKQQAWADFGVQEVPTGMEGTFVIGKDSRICPAKQLSVELIAAFLQNLEKPKWALVVTDGKSFSPDKKALTLASTGQKFGSYVLLAVDPKKGTFVRGGLGDGKECKTHLQCKTGMFCFDNSRLTYGTGECTPCFKNGEEENCSKYSSYTGERLGKGSVDNSCMVCNNHMFNGGAAPEESSTEESSTEESTPKEDPSPSHSAPSPEGLVVAEEAK